MKIDKDTGLIEWIPKGKDRGNNTVIVEVSDGNLTDEQEFVVFVSASEKRKESVQSSTSGNVGGRGSGGGKVFVKELGQGNKKSVIRIKIPLKAVVLKVEELNERPKDGSRISRRVYKYLRIENIGQADIKEAIINFTVDLGWLNENGIGYDQIVLSRYTKDGWQDLITKNVSKDNNFVYYIAKTPGFSYFAITIKEGVIVKSVLNPQISRLALPYRISGTIYKFGKFRQADLGTRFTIENLNTSEIISGKTGIGPNPGAYSVLLHGRGGDLIKIKIGDIEKEYLTRLKDVDNLDFMINIGNMGFTRITGYTLFELPNRPLLLFFISSVFIFLLIIFIKFKYKKDD
jgi:PGF-pre-PGF domain-containing protein